MAYLEVDTRQGNLVVDIDKISGVGEAVQGSDTTLTTVVLFLIGDQVDLHLHSPEQGKKLVEEVKKIIVARKARNPIKAIIVNKE